MELTKYVQIGSMIVAAATTIAGIWKYVIVPLWNFTKKLASLISLADQHGKLLELIAKEFQPNGGNSLRDILDRIEKNSSSTENKVKALIAYHDIALFETDGDGHITWVSKKFCDITGLLPSEAMGNGWISAIDHDQRDKVYAEWLDALKQKREFSKSFFVGNEEIGFMSVTLRTILIRNKLNAVVGSVGTLDINDENKLH